MIPQLDRFNAMKKMSTHELGKAVDGFLLPLSPAKARKKSFLKSFDITHKIQDNNSL